MAKVYSRSLADRQIFVSRLAQKAFKGDRNADPLKTDPPEISEENQIGGKSPNAEILGKKPAGWAIAILKKRENLDTLKKDRVALRVAFGKFL